MIVVYVLYLASEGLERGRVTGRLEQVETGDTVLVHDSDELIHALTTGEALEKRSTMRLFGTGTKSAPEIRLGTGGPVRPGETVTCCVSVGEVDGKVRGGCVELVYRNTYDEEYRDSDGDRSKRTRTADVVVDSRQLFPHGPAAGEVTVDFTVPAAGPASSPGSVDWQVRAVIDRKLSRDPSTVTPLLVLAPAGLHADWARLPARHPADLPVRFELDSRVLRPGQRLTGVAVLAPSVAVSARSIRLELVRERVGDHASDRSVHKVPVCGKTELTAGSSATFPIELTVPADAPPSFAAARSSQHWYVQLVLDRAVRSDHIASVEVVVANA